MELTRQNIGNAGEYFVAYQLESRGITVVHANTKGFDLLAITPSGIPVPIQVKATTKTQRSQSSGRRKSGKVYYSIRYRFNLKRHDEFPLHAFVALDIPAFFLRNLATAPGSYPTNNVLDIAPSYFTDEAMEASIKEHLS